MNLVGVFRLHQNPSARHGVTLFGFCGATASRLELELRSRFSLRCRQIAYGEKNPIFLPPITSIGERF